MTETEFSILLSDLTTTAKILNEKSDSVNALIEQFQDTLRRLNIGLEVWPVTLTAETWTEEDTDGDKHEHGYIDAELGFAKLDGEWVLATRVAFWAHDYAGSGDTDGDGNEVMIPVLGTRHRLVRAEAATPLLNASRGLRIRALEHFPAIVEALKDEAEEAIGTIDAAAAYVK